MVGGVVVLGLVCSGAFGFFFGFGGERTPQAYIKRLEDPNNDIRWRAANDLVQVLKRDDDLASDPDLGFKLAELLVKEREEIASDEKSFLERRSKLSEEEAAKEMAKIRGRRDYARFLSACLGSMILPQGAEALQQMAVEQGTDPEATALMRRHAVWMLANLGENLKRFQGDGGKYKGLSAERRTAVIARLREQ